MTNTTNNTLKLLRNKSNVAYNKANAKTKTKRQMMYHIVCLFDLLFQKI